MRTIEGSFDEVATTAVAAGRRAAALVETTAGPDPSLIETTAGGATSDMSVRTVVSPADGEAPLVHGFERGHTIGRYVVVGELGTGGMGVVYAAYDPELDRRVALKLLRPDIGATAGDEPRARLLREALALAKLSHPHVVAIHDVGAVGDAVWLAMEFVEGETLRTWSSKRRRGWREVLDVMRSAGRGLAAAHAAGLVHRDFKPDNVMVSVDGRVRVMDLGLARRGAAAPTEAPLPGRGELSLELTHAGAVLGTPAYMAPEQIAGDEVGPPADIFAFCVTFWEALYGERPFAGESYADLAANVGAGRRRPPPRGRTAPRWLRRIVERGLAVEPARRWPGVQQLVDALDRGQTRARASTGAIAAAVVAAAVGAGWANQRSERAATVAACEASGASIDALWNDAARESVRAGLLKTGLGYAATTAERVTPWLDRQADGWRAAKTEVCVAAEVHGTWDADARARSDQCLEDRRLELASLISSLSRATPESLQRAIGAAASQVPIAACREPALLARVPLAPVELREQVQSVREAILATLDHEANGKFEDGLTAARAALKAAEAVGWAPLVAGARMRIGALQHAKGDLAGAEQTLEAAYFEASAAGAVGLAADIATLLSGVVSARARHDDAKLWSRHAELQARALEPEPGLRAARRLLAYGQILNATADYPGARATFEQVLALQEAILGAAHPDLGGTLSDLAGVRKTMGDLADAQELYGRALAVAEEALGRDHPQVGAIVYSLAQLRLEQRATSEALALAERSLGIFGTSYGPRHVHVARALLLIGNIRERLGQQAEARRAFEQALAIQEAALGPDHPHVGAAVATLASVHLREGDYDESIRLGRRAIAIFERALGPDHPDVGKALKNLANTYKAKGDQTAARPLYERSLAIREKALGPDHPQVALNLIDVGKIHLALGMTTTARAHFERALAIAERKVPPERQLIATALAGLAETAARERRFAELPPLVDRATALLAGDGFRPDEVFGVAFRLARALGDSGPANLPRARALAEQARAAIATTGPAQNVAEIDEWLAAHPLKAPRK